jgi:large subunit ribosomal protein L1
MGKTKTAFVGENPDEKNKVKSQKAHKAEEGRVHIAGLKGGQRVKVVEAAETEQAPILEVTKFNKKIERVRGKKYVESKKAFDREKYYPVAEAVKLVKSTSYSKFDGTMELHLIVKKTGTSAQVTLPFQAGRQKKVEIATDETIEKLKKGVIDFDVLVATPTIMPKLVPFARLLGPKGLMPNPKNGTLVADEKKAKAYSTGSIVIKTEKEAPLVHTVVGKNSQPDNEITANIEAILKAMGGAKQIVKAYLTSSMSPSVKLILN